MVAQGVRPEDPGVVLLAKVQSERYAKDPNFTYDRARRGFAAFAKCYEKITASEYLPRCPKCEAVALPDELEEYGECARCHFPADDERKCGYCTLNFPADELDHEGYCETCAWKIAQLRTEAA